MRVTRDLSGCVSVRFHKTDIVTAAASGTVTLNSGGWKTATTLRAMNDILRAISIQVSICISQH